MRRIGLAGASRQDAAPPPGIAEVYEAHFQYVWRCLRGLGVAEAQLDDAVQDVFMVVHRRLAEFDGQARLTTWLYEIALRISRRYRSRAAKEAERQDPHEPLPEESAAIEVGVDRHRQLALARAALEALPIAKREVFVLACIEQRSAPEIAGLIGIPTNTVYSRIRAAKQAFATELRRQQIRRGGLA